MKVRGTRSTIAVVTTLVVAALMLTALVAVIGSAQAAPQKKVFDATVDVQDTATLSPTSARLRLTLRNDASSNQTLGSANFAPPTGVTVQAVVVQPSPPANATTSRTGWTATNNGNVVEFRSTSNPLTVSASVFADVDVTISGCATATWTAHAKQSNDFSGSGNDFTANAAASNLRPLGSFVIDDIETVVPADPDDLHVPQILTNTDEDVHVTPFDICGAVYSNYGSSAGKATAFVANPAVPTRLVGAGSLSINWTTGITTLNPKVVETGDFLTISDPLSTPGQTIGARSNDFDVVEKLCTSLDTSCEWQFANGRIKAQASPPPAPTGGDVPSLGIGFNSDLTFKCPGTGGPVSPVGGALVNINPRDYPTNDPITVTLIYRKSDTGSGPATGFSVCLSKDNGQTWDNPLAECPNSPQPSNAPCVTRKRVTGGDLSVAFYIRPTDPWGGAR
jgi:hypothetical protein